MEKVEWLELAAATLMVLTLVLNGVEVEMPFPIISELDEYGARQIAIPVRETFEAAGFVVQYHARNEPYIEITGHIEHLPRRHRLTRVGQVYPDRAQVRVNEYSSDLPFAPQRLDGRMYAPAIVLRIIGGGDLQVDLGRERIYWDTYPPDDPPLLSVSELVSDLPAWVHRRVRIEGVFNGSDPAGRPASLAGGAPAVATWVVHDESGAIHCTDTTWIGHLIIRSPEFSPGQQVAVEGIVRVGWGGMPYLSNAEIAVSPEDG